MENKKIALLIVQHLANAPRAQKEAGSLARAGAEVTVFGSWWNSERAEEDLEIAKQLGIKYIPLLDQRNAPLASRLTGKIARELFKRFGWVMPEAYGPNARAMVKAVKKLQPDLTMVHCEPALWAGRKLHKVGFKVGIDFEDWFSEDLFPENRKERPVEAIAEAEKFMLRNATVSFATTRAMSTALQKWADVDTPPIVIPNCFPWSEAPKETGNPDKRDPNCLSLYWFSQTIGPQRGLEVLAEALSKVTGEWQLHLRGNISTYQKWFKETFPLPIRERIVMQPIVSNADLPAHSASHDIGLALEIPYCPNKELTASNKIFEYLRCGLATIATQTEGQAEVLSKNPSAGWMVPAENAEALKNTIQHCLDHPEEISEAKQAAKEIAAKAWSWEKYEPILVEAVQECLSR